MSLDTNNSIDQETNEKNGAHAVRFDDRIYMDDDPPEAIALDEDNNLDLMKENGVNRVNTKRRKSGILKRRENTITTADAPRIILSDEGLTAGRVSPFINFPLFLSMSVRSVGIIFGDM